MDKLLEPRKVSHEVRGTGIATHSSQDINNSILVFVTWDNVDDVFCGWYNLKEIKQVE